MDIKIIEDIAKKTGMDMYDGPRLTKLGNGMMGFISSGELTPHGQNLVAFANAVERTFMKCDCGRDLLPGLCSVCDDARILADHARQVCCVPEGRGL